MYQIYSINTLNNSGSKYKCKWSLDGNSVYGGILTDLSKAFDCLPPRLLTCISEKVHTEYMRVHAC